MFQGRREHDHKSIGNSGKKENKAGNAETNTVFPRKMETAPPGHPQQVVKIFTKIKCSWYLCPVAWPSGLRRWFKAPVSSEAWVRIPPLPSNMYIYIYFFAKMHMCRANELQKKNYADFKYIVKLSFSRCLGNAARSTRFSY